jgi:transposase
MTVDKICKNDSRITISRWNELRLRELLMSQKKGIEKLENSHDYPRKTSFTCSDCNEPVHDEKHIDDGVHAKTFPRRQVICTVCQKTDYRFLTDVEMARLSA